MKKKEKLDPDKEKLEKEIFGISKGDILKLNRRMGLSLSEELKRARKRKEKELMGKPGWSGKR